MYPSIQVGKYLVSPLVRRDQAGRYIASVSIRSGHASMTQDRLMRFTPFFESAQAAVDSQDRGLQLHPGAFAARRARVTTRVGGGNIASIRHFICDKLKV